jgi:hypothetical protein
MSKAISREELSADYTDGQTALINREPNLWPCLKTLRIGLQSVLLIHTWLQPGVRNSIFQWKPFKRFPKRAAPRVTWLKPGVNESRSPTFGAKPRTTMLI